MSLPAQMAVAGVVGAGFGYVISVVIFPQPDRKKFVVAGAVLGMLAPLIHKPPPVPGCTTTDAMRPLGWAAAE